MCVECIWGHLCEALNQFLNWWGDFLCVQTGSPSSFLWAQRSGGWAEVHPVFTKEQVLSSYPVSVPKLNAFLAWET